MFRVYGGYGKFGGYYCFFFYILFKVMLCFFFKIDYLDFENDIFDNFFILFLLFFFKWNWLKIKNYSWGYSVGYIMVYVNCIFEYWNGIVCILVILLKFWLKIKFFGCIFKVFIIL